MTPEELNQLADAWRERRIQRIEQEWNALIESGDFEQALAQATIAETEPVPDDPIAAREQSYADRYWAANEAFERGEIGVDQLAGFVQQEDQIEQDERAKTRAALEFF